MLHELHNFHTLEIKKKNPYDYVSVLVFLPGCVNHVAALRSFLSRFTPRYLDTLFNSLQHKTTHMILTDSIKTNVTVPHECLHF